MNDPSLRIVHPVFVASPGGLAAEREAFRDAIQTCNEMDAISRGVLFVPVGWESTLPGMERPQSLINEDLRDCDYFLLMLWDFGVRPPATRTTLPQRAKSMAWRANA